MATTAAKQERAARAKAWTERELWRLVDLHGLRAFSRTTPDYEWVMCLAANLATVCGGPARLETAWSEVRRSIRARLLIRFGDVDEVGRAIDCLERCRTEWEARAAAVADDLAVIEPRPLATTHSA